MTRRVFALSNAAIHASLRNSLAQCPKRTTKSDHESSILSLPELPDVGFLAEVPSEHRAFRTGFGRFLRFHKDDVVLAEGLAQESLSMVLAGALHVVSAADDRPILLATLGEGDFRELDQRLLENRDAVSTLIHQGPLALFAAFVVVHALGDFPLQGEYLSRQKSRRSADSRSEWIVALIAHCVIQAGGVWLVSGSLAFAAVELVLHGVIDLGKGEGKIGIVSDQLLHLACKLGYVAWVSYG